MGTTSEKLSYLKETKTAIKDAIIAKGVEVPEGTTFREYAAKVGEIQTGTAVDFVNVTCNLSGYSGANIYYTDENFQPKSILETSENFVIKVPKNSIFEATTVRPMEGVRFSGSFQQASSSKSAFITGDCTISMFG